MLRAGGRSTREGGSPLLPHLRRLPTPWLSAAPFRHPAVSQAPRVWGTVPPCPPPPPPREPLGYRQPRQGPEGSPVPRGRHHQAPSLSRRWRGSPFKPARGHPHPEEPLSRRGLSLRSRAAPAVPERVVVPHEAGALGGGQQCPLQEEAEAGPPAEAEPVADEADEVGDEAHLAGLQQQPAQGAARAARRRVIEEQPQPYRPATAGGRHFEGEGGRRRERATAPRAGQKGRAAREPRPRPLRAGARAGPGGVSCARDSAGAASCWRDGAAARRDRAVGAAAGGRYGAEGRHGVGRHGTARRGGFCPALRLGRAPGSAGATASGHVPSRPALGPRLSRGRFPSRGRDRRPGVGSRAGRGEGGGQGDGAVGAPVGAGRARGGPVRCRRGLSRPWESSRPTPAGVCAPRSPREPFWSRNVEIQVPVDSPG